MTEFPERHHLHDRSHRIGLLAAYDLARHYRADGVAEHRSTTFAQHTHDVALRQDAFDAALAHHQHGADLTLPENLDSSGKLRLRLDALDIVAFGIENCTYRHCRLPEADRAPSSERGLYSI